MHRITGKGIIIFLFFHFHSLTSIHLFSSSRFLPLLLNGSICNYQTDSWRHLLYLEICILFVFSLMHLSRRINFDISKWNREHFGSYQNITLLLQSEQLDRCWLIDVDGFPLSTATVNSVVSLQLSTFFSSTYNFSCERLCFTFSISLSHFLSVVNSLGVISETL